MADELFFPKSNRSFFFVVFEPCTNDLNKHFEGLSFNLRKKKRFCNSCT